MNDRRNRNGFTLLEVIIASSLAATLLLLVWSLFSIYSKLNDKGVRKATELQIVRSLMRQLRSDLHNARTSSMLTRSDFAAVAQAMNDGSSTAFAGEDSDLMLLPTGAQLVGTGTRFQVVVRTPRRRTAHRAVEKTSDEVVAPPDLCDVVEYVWQPRPGPLMPGVEVSVVDDFRRESADEVREGQAPGLIRRMTPWFQRDDDQDPDGSNESFTSPDPSFESRREAEMAPELWRQSMNLEDAVPEVSSLRFRYFDGSVWLSHWDSGQTGRLPAAMEIAFDVVPEEQQADERQRRANNQTDQHSIEETSSAVELSQVSGSDIAEETAFEYRFVIAVDTEKTLHPGEESMLP